MLCGMFSVINLDPFLNSHVAYGTFRTWRDVGIRNAPSKRTSGLAESRLIRPPTIPLNRRAACIGERGAGLQAAWCERDGLCIRASSICGTISSDSNLLVGSSVQCVQLSSC